MPWAPGQGLEDNWGWNDDLGEKGGSYPPPVVLEDEPEEDWPEDDGDDDLYEWEDRLAKEEAERYLRDDDLERLQEDMERQACQRSLCRKWYYWEVCLDRLLQRSWKHHRRIRHAWQRPLKWRREHRRAACAFARELDRHAAVTAMNETRPFGDTPAPKYKI